MADTSLRALSHPSFRLPASKHFSAPRSSSSFFGRCLMTWWTDKSLLTLPDRVWCVQSEFSEPFRTTFRTTHGFRHQLPASQLSWLGSTKTQLKSHSQITVLDWSSLAFKIYRQIQTIQYNPTKNNRQQNKTKEIKLKFHSEITGLD